MRATGRATKKSEDEHLEYGARATHPVARGEDHFELPIHHAGCHVEYQADDNAGHAELFHHRRDFLTRARHIEDGLCASERKGQDLRGVRVAAGQAIASGTYAPS